MNKVVFLDRDGVINDGTLYYTYKVKDFIINTGVIEALQKLQIAGYSFIIITNQSGVAKGEYSLEDVNTVHEYMLTELQKKAITVLGIYVCPHHPTVSECNCRKPKTALFERAIEEHNVDVTKSYMIGDSDRDIIAANKVGITGIKINKNENILPVCNQILE